ncbi:ActS/PrrB/RegB family redox-sensitive histidine kinase [Amylibacter sp. SFDW26]|uniref:sensor histidine kinase RegB n=1 Tax=Amylibacter sp. SFDW26 TaxID=2652722 RepID=UPI001261E033|nr:ActS/PrrB/RegB family redox-sensitive histidine kinase [Amylibacter sp. SFDW26]KAB7614623.1 ActS/PrrB/RegB family redox-sensitive histidine kinase [Amylibacter sp. SFDW26]
MSQPSTNLFTKEARSDWIRLRTLVILRWLAIAGQTGAVVAAVYYLELAIPFRACLIVITAAVLFNISATLILPANKRLSEREAMLSLLFDLAQLILLLYLTGGLHNPFSMLILAPVTIAATALTFNATLVISITALITITLLTFVYTPLARQTGEILEVQNIFLGGMWFALTIGILFLASYARRVTVEMFSMSQALSATQMALAREYKLTALGGVVAAAAHEMGTPLATIKLVSSELASELKEDADLHDDAILIKEQADRLSQILRDMGRSGKDDLLLRHAPLTAIIHEAAEPHEGRGKIINFTINGKDEDMFAEDTPIISRHPEIIHGLRNLVQNAVDFSRANVWVDATWDEASVRIIVADDGNGYPSDLLDRIGDPFISKRSRQNQRAQDFSEYQGMGLGLFIAKTLLERSGAELTFANASADTNEKHHIVGAKIKGALVNVRWERAGLEKDPADIRGALGLNQQFETSS